MPVRSPGDPKRRIAILASLLIGVVAVPGLTLAGSATSLLLPDQGDATHFIPTVPPVDVGQAPVLVAQNQQSAAQLLVRIQELEDQVRTLTGQVEGLQFQLTQMQTMIQKQNEDNEFRFQQLEGGTPGKKTEAATPADGATPSDTLPPASNTDANAPASADQPAASDQPQSPDGATVPANGQLTPLAQDDDGGLGQSSDPLLKGGVDQLGTLPEGDAASVGTNQPLNLDSSGGVLNKGDAKAQYDAGYDAITRGDYVFAEDQFTQFIQLFPDDALAPDATNWLGEALLQRGDYTDAAQVLAEGYTKYKDSKRAPDMMLKLGVALAGADQGEVACRTFYTLKQRYPNLSAAFKQRLADEQQKAKCPVQ